MRAHGKFLVARVKGNAVARKIRIKRHSEYAAGLTERKGEGVSVFYGNGVSASVRRTLLSVCKNFIFGCAKIGKGGGGRFSCEAGNHAAVFKERILQFFYVLFGVILY